MDAGARGSKQIKKSAPIGVHPRPLIPFRKAA
jgi:hypothetical protein